MRWTYLWHTSLLHLMLVGCTVGPTYERPPEVDIPEEWSSVPSEGMHAGDPESFVWWESFQDPLLNSLMQQAAQQNLDLFIAGTRILEARAKRLGKTAALYPHVDASLTTGHLHYNKKEFINRIVGNTCGQHRGKNNIHFFEIGFDADWEIDLFGMTQHEIQVAKAQLEATQEGLCDIWVTLSAEVARNYVELRSLQTRLQIVEEKIASHQESVNLIQDLLHNGMSNALDALQIEEQLYLLAAQKPVLQLAIDKTIYRLSILLGCPPGTLLNELRDPQALPPLPENKPLGLPSQLLRRRPDIRKAERNLAATTEAIGSAVAALFPRLSLYGFIGEISTQLKSLTSSGTWFVAPQLLLPIFNSRLLLQDVDFNKIKNQQALFEYQKSVLTALEEVENAIASFHYGLEHHDQLAKAQQIEIEKVQLTLQLYERGLKDYLEVLAVNRSVLTAEETLIQSQTELLLHYISLYKALGGGWDVGQCASAIALDFLRN